MQISDKNTNPFLSVGDFEYISKLQHIDTSLNKLIGEIIDAQAGDPNLLARLTVILNSAVLKSGLIQNLSAENFKITNLQDGTNPQDAVNFRTAQSIFLGGGTPSSIPVTELGTGSATSLQLLRINLAGNAIEGYTFSDSWLPTFDDDFAAAPNKKHIVDTTTKNIISTLPAAPEIGSYYKFSCYGVAEFYLTLAKNGNQIYYANELIDQNGSGDLLLNNGDFAEIVCFAANKYMVI